MNWIKRYLPLLAMWLIIIGVLSGLPFASQWVASKWVTGLPLYRFSWVVVAGAALAPGDRLTQDQAELRLDYLKYEKNTTVHTMTSVLNRYAQKEFKKEEPLEHDGFGPAPLLEAPSNGLIVPVSVKLEYTEGLKPGMRVHFEKARTPETQTVQPPRTKDASKKGSGSQAQVKGKEPHRLVSASAHSEPTSSNNPAKEPLVVTLKTIVPSQDKKSAVLYVGATTLDTDSVQELTSADLVPIILPATR